MVRREFATDHADIAIGIDHDRLVAVTLPLRALDLVLASVGMGHAGRIVAAAIGVNDLRAVVGLHLRSAIAAAGFGLGLLSMAATLTMPAAAAMTALVVIGQSRGVECQCCGSYR